MGVPGFRLFRGVNVARNIQIVLISTDFLTGDYACEGRVRRIALDVSVSDTLDVGSREFILLANFLGQA